MREAVEKLAVRGKAMTKSSLAEELDMGPKEWSRFGEEILKYVENLRTSEIPAKSLDTRRVVVISGYPGTEGDSVIRRVGKGEIRRNVGKKWGMGRRPGVAGSSPGDGPRSDHVQRSPCHR